MTPAFDEFLVELAHLGEHRLERHGAGLAVLGCLDDHHDLHLRVPFAEAPAAPGWFMRATSGPDEIDIAERILCPAYVLLNVLVP